MSYQTLVEQFRDSLKTAYRQAVDADALLEQLQKAGHGKYQTVFKPDAGFRTQANRFTPYVQELADDLTQFEQEQDASKLPDMVKRLEQLLSTLAHLRHQLKG